MTANTNQPGAIWRDSLEDFNMAHTDTHLDPDTVYVAMRHLYPRSRRLHPAGIEHNGSRRRIVGCIYCGDDVSCCGDYPETKAVAAFRAKHDKECGAKIVREFVGRFSLVDDSPLDTVVLLPDGREMRYSGEVASCYRDDTGALDFARFVV